MLFSQKLNETGNFHFHDPSFVQLMQKRIYRVLIISSNYDFYMLEEDGRIDEQIFDEYVSLNLRYPPFFIHANSIQKAFKIINTEPIDLVITMLSVGSSEAFGIAKAIKDYQPEIPIVILTPFSREVQLKMQTDDLSAIDYVFCWLGNMEILLAIIKLIEDRMNVQKDVDGVGVQVLLLVEDSIRFYSGYLPLMYRLVLQQSRFSMKEGLNDLSEMLRMRGRPKILLATNYEEAIVLYEKYKDNMLGVISDIRYQKNGKEDKEAGFKLHEHISKDNLNLSFLLQSAEKKNLQKAYEKNISFIFKHSQNLSNELRDYLVKNLAFGDFIFRQPQGNETDRASDLKSLQTKLKTLPHDSLKHHFDRNDFARWLNARALFPLAQKFKNLKLSDFPTISDAKKYMDKMISSYRLSRSRGVIAKFDKNTYDDHFIFSRIGIGPMGGKARGLAFLDSILKKNNTCSGLENIVVSIPRTVVLCTDIFDNFMRENNLMEKTLRAKSDEEILNLFIQAKFSETVKNDLKVFLSIVKKPVAIRSSSILEDSHYHPFAGIYSTYMIPNPQNDKATTLKMLIASIKGVYASVFFQTSRSYMATTSNMIDEEKMGIILQEICGNKYKNDNYGRFYPTLSGVARSINYYPIPPEKSGDGIANIALGLGKIAVEGGNTLRFSPKHPKRIIQLSSTKMTLKSTQKYFYALDLNPEQFKISTNDAVNIEKLRIKTAENDSSIKYVSSSFDFQNNILRDGYNYPGKKIITFSNILKHEIFPLSKILDTILQLGQKELNTPVELEFAANLDVPKGTPQIFNVLQIRPISETNSTQDINLKNIDKNKTIIYSETALGNGIINNLHDFVYVKPQSFDSSRNKELVQIIENINKTIASEGKNYILTGPGRWGSNDPWLGIPIKWPQISAARLIIESGLENYRIEPSQGTHFFHNLTAFKVGYFTINPFINEGFYNIDFLDKQPAVFENNFIRHVRFEKELTVKIDGKHNVGAVFMPKI